MRCSYVKSIETFRHQGKASIIDRQAIAQQVAAAAATTAAATTAATTTAATTIIVNACKAFTATWEEGVAT